MKGRGRGRGEGLGLLASAQSPPQGKLSPYGRRSPTLASKCLWPEKWDGRGSLFRIWDEIARVVISCYSLDYQICTYKAQRARATSVHSDRLEHLQDLLRPGNGVLIEGIEDSKVRASSIVVT